MGSQVRFVLFFVASGTLPETALALDSSPPRPDVPWTEEDASRWEVSTPPEASPESSVEKVENAGPVAFGLRLGGVHAWVYGEQPLQVPYYASPVVGGFEIAVKFHPRFWLGVVPELAWDLVDYWGVKGSITGQLEWWCSRHVILSAGLGYTSSYFFRSAQIPFGFTYSLAPANYSGGSFRFGFEVSPGLENERSSGSMELWGGVGYRWQ